MHRLVPNLLVVLLASLSPAARAQSPVTEKDLDKAIAALVDIKSYPYPPKTDEGYAEGDYFDENGKLQRNKHWQDRDGEKWKPCVDCATFAGPVLHHLCTGKLKGFKATDAWAKQDGAGMAKHFKLAPTGPVTVKDLLTELADPEWCKAHAGTYFFDLDGKHIGFLVVRDDGTHRQVQFSAASAAGPLDNGNLPAYLKGANGKRFKNITLYRVMQSAPESKT